MSPKRKEKLKEQKGIKDQMKQMFLEIWDERQDGQGRITCFETGKVMSREVYRELSSVYDHVLEKSTYPEYTLVKKNIVIILPDVHNQKGMNIDFTPKIKAYREELLALHKKGELKDD